MITTKVQKKIENEHFEALNKIRVIRANQFSWDIIDFNSVINHFNWGFFRNKEKHPDFHDLGLSMCDYAREGQISKYQTHCLVKLSSVLYDAKVLYENNLIDFTQLHNIVVRVRDDAHKRFKSIKKCVTKNALKNQNLDSDSLLLLQAKLAILENEN